MKNASNKWSSETINDILSNPFYAGNTVMNKYITNYMTKTCKKNKNKDTWIIKENTHEAIIPQEKYNKVQDIKKSKFSKKENEYHFLLKRFTLLWTLINTNYNTKYISQKIKQHIYIIVVDLYVVLFIRNQINVKTKYL